MFETDIVADAFNSGYESQAQHLAQHVGIGPIEYCAHVLAVVCAALHEQFIDVVADEHDAVEHVLALGHVTFDLASGLY